MIDVVHQINEVRRRVGERVLEAGQARTVTVSQTYDATVEEVWDACTKADRISRWFLPVSGDLRPGGRYQLEGNASGTVERCDPPRSFAATWEFGGGVTWIEVRVTAESASRTRFEIEHIALVDDRWTEFGPGAVGIGWDMALIGLAKHLSSGEGVDPKEGAAWAASEDGKRFMTLSSERWGEADVAAGADPVDAKARADRTTAAYTATPASE
ncbi:MAG: SRPBCC family protein [Candidatus Dormibacteraeota bacterium]|nr:SRPBCC family protein [Candidatus Dormibacteraeota bacterium]